MSQHAGEFSSDMATQSFPIFKRLLPCDCHGTGSGDSPSLRRSAQKALAGKNPAISTYMKALRICSRRSMRRARQSQSATKRSRRSSTAPKSERLAARSSTCITWPVRTQHEGRSRPFRNRAGERRTATRAKERQQDRRELGPPPQCAILKAAFLSKRSAWRDITGRKLPNAR